MPEGRPYSLGNTSADMASINATSEMSASARGRSAGRVLENRLHDAGKATASYPQARRGQFTCSDPLLNDIWDVGVRSVECCSEDTYTDCPTYEQTFWVGDGRNEALVDLLANGDPRLSANSLRVAAS